MAIGPARMSLMEHLGELRMRLVRVIVCLIAATCVFYLSTGTVVQFLLAPVAEFMPTDGNGDVMLNVLGAFDAFSVRITVALWTAVVATAPITLWQILAFFLPALKPRERKWFLPTFIAALALFIMLLHYPEPRLPMAYRPGFGFCDHSSRSWPVGRHHYQVRVGLRHWL